MQLLIISFIIIFFASLTQSLIGFGFSLISVAILVNFYEVKLVVAMVLIFNFIIDFIIWYRNRHLVQIKKIILLFFASIVGMPVGVYLLLILNANILKFIAGFIILLTAITMLFGFTSKLKNKKSTIISIGFVSGLLQGSVHVGGPPIALFLANYNMERKVFRANIIAYFTLLNIVTIFWFIYKGLFTEEVLINTAYLLPGLVLGLILGIVLVNKIKEGLFRKIVLGIIVLGSISSILSSFNIF